MLRFMTTALVAAAIAAPAIAAPQPVTIDRDGAHFRYTTELTKSGAILIHGQDLQTAEPLDLVVDARGHVDGTIGVAAVSFMVPQAQRDRIFAALNAPAAGPELAAIK
ncbi:MAG: hypothetical protein ABIV23_02205 [Sphingomicrobium sp.]